MVWQRTSEVVRGARTHLANLATAANTATAANWARALPTTPFVALLFTTLALGSTMRAQDATFFRTRDGNAFLLVPMRTRTVHWINLHPARIADEPIAHPDLALAIARSSLLGEARPGEAAARPEKANPLAWEEALRRAPTGGSQLVRVDDYIGVRVTFPARSIGQVAQLMRTRTHRAKLHSIAEHYREAQLAREARLARTPDLELLRRALDHADPKRKLGSWFVRGGEEEIDEDEVLAFYKWNTQPARAINVLVGGFEPEFTKSVLEEIYRELVVAPEKPPSSSTDVLAIRSPVVRDRKSVV